MQGEWEAVDPLQCYGHSPSASFHRLRSPASRRLSTWRSGFCSAVSETFLKFLSNVCPGSLPRVLRTLRSTRKKWRRPGTSPQYSCKFTGMLRSVCCMLGGFSFDGLLQFRSRAILIYSLLALLSSNRFWALPLELSPKVGLMFVRDPCALRTLGRQRAATSWRRWGDRTPLHREQEPLRLGFGPSPQGRAHNHRDGRGKGIMTTPGREALAQSREVASGDASTLDILFVEIDLFDARFLNHMRFSQASLWFVFTKSSSAFGTTLRNRPASAGTIDTIASTISFGSR